MLIKSQASLTCATINKHIYRRKCKINKTGNRVLVFNQKKKEPLRCFVSTAIGANGVVDDDIVVVVVVVVANADKDWIINA